jgi:hypothetical protein
MRFLRRGHGSDGGSDSQGQSSPSGPLPSSGERPKDIPAWAQFMTPPEYLRFMTLVNEWLQAKAPRFRTIEGGVEVLGPGSEATQIGLDNIAQTCRLLPPELWRDRIANFLGSVLFAPRTATDIPFEEAQTMIKVRLYPESFGDRGGGSGQGACERSHCARTAEDAGA